jgi:hypothetical protein
MESCIPANARPHYFNLRSQKYETLRIAYEKKKAEHLRDMALRNTRRSGWDDVKAWENKAEFLNKSVYAEFEAFCETCELYGIALDARMCEKINTEAKKSLTGKYRAAIQSTASGVSDVRIPNSVMQQLAGNLNAGRFPVLRDIAIEVERWRVTSAKRRNQVSGYNKVLSVLILEHLHEIFPSKTNSGQLAKQVAPSEPYEEVLTAIEALNAQGQISCKILRGNDGIEDAAFITITNAGNAWLGARDNSKPSPAPIIVVHGDHNVNYGQAGVIGRNAAEAQVNYGQIWQQSQAKVDLQQVASELVSLRTEFRKIATSVDDDQQLGFLAEAEKEAKAGNGSKVLDILSKIGAPMLTKILETGTSVGLKCLLNALNIPTT